MRMWSYIGPNSGPGGTNVSDSRRIEGIIISPRSPALSRGQKVLRLFRMGEIFLPVRTLKIFCQIGV